MVLRFGNTEIPNTATITYNGYPVKSVVYNGTTVWQSGPGLSTELEFSKTPILLHFDERTSQLQNSDNADAPNAGNTSIKTYGFGRAQFSSYGNSQNFANAYYLSYQGNNPGFVNIGGLTMTAAGNYSVEARCKAGMNNYSGTYYNELVFAESGGDTSATATVNAIWRMRLTRKDATSATLTIGNSDWSTTNYTGAEGGVTTTDGMYHLAATYNGNNTWTFFAQGVRIGTYSYTGASTGFNFVLLCNGQNYDSGYWDEFVVHSYARYTGNFTVPAEPYTVV